MRRQYSGAKQFWRVHIALEFSRLGIAVYLLAGGTQLLLASGLAIAAPLASYFVKRAADAAYGHAERMRRVLYLQDGLGRRPSQADVLDLRAGATWLPDLDPLPVGSYYMSPLPVGPQRLAHICEEAAFHTRGYANLAAAFFFGIAAAGVALASLLMWYALQTAAPAQALVTLGRVGSSLLTFFAAGSFVTMAFSFHGLGLAAQRAFDRLDKLASSASATSEDVLLVLSSYDCTLAKTQPIPTAAYRILRRRLNEAWQEHGQPQA
jgi:hypothetical protein